MTLHVVAIDECETDQIFLAADEDREILREMFSWRHVTKA